VERLVIAHDKSMESLFVAAARDLQDEGVCAVVGCCGFMALFQKSVASAIKVPALLSSVMQLPIIISSISPDKRVGVITANSLSLTSELLDAAGIGEVFSRLCIRGLEDKPEARGALLEERGSLNDAVIRDEVLDTVGAMLRETSDIGAILLECSELPPYARYVQKLTGLPVFDFVTMIDYLRSGLAHRLYINQRRRSVCSNVLRSSSLGFV
jgi:Asp/Glu/hydantoin racemase